MAIAIRGTPTANQAGNGGNVTLSMPTGVAQNDVVYVASSSNAASSGGTSSSGWTQVGSTLDNTVRLQIFRKVMGASPDASIVLVGTGNANDSLAAVAIAFSGADTTTPEDGVAPTTATGNSTNPDPASITPATNNAAAIAFSANSINDISGNSAPTGYSNFQQAGQTDTNSTSVRVGWKGGLSAGVAEDPGTFGGVSTSTWGAFTIVVRESGAVPASPFTPDDFPNPRKITTAPGFVNQTAINLIGQDQFFGAPGESKVYDYPNPRSAPRSQDLQTWKNFYDPSMPFVWKWEDPNPKAAPRSIDLRTHTAQPLPELYGQDQFFWAPGEGPRYDYPNPRAPLRSIDLRTHLDPFKLNLLGQDQFYGAPGESPSRDWPNPQIPRRSAELRTWINTVIPPSAAATPFVSAIFAPSLPARSIVQTWINTFIPAVGTPFFPKPTAENPRPRIEVRSWLNTFIPVVGTPFKPVDLAGQIRARANQQGWVNTFVPTATQAPFKSITFDNPRRARASVQDWRLSLLQSTLAPTTAVPFRAIEWRVPGPKVRGDSSWTVNLLLNTLATPSGHTHFRPRVSASGVQASVTGTGAKARVKGAGITASTVAPGSRARTKSSATKAKTTAE